MYLGSLEWLKPKIGDKLNKRCIVTFNNVTCPENLTEH